MLSKLKEAVSAIIHENVLERSLRLAPTNGPLLSSEHFYKHNFGFMKTHWLFSAIRFLGRDDSNKGTC